MPDECDISEPQACCANSMMDMPRRHSIGFGDALKWLKGGHRLRREGWNAPGMHIALHSGYPEGVPANRSQSRAHGIPEGTQVVIRPYLMMFTFQGDFVPWVASQSDLLAEDWSIVNDPPKTRVESPLEGLQKRHGGKY